jgi:shikimate kinase
VTSLRIYLTGYMGAGKSTIGRQLAIRLNYRFVDTDREIIKGFGKSISRIFSEDGEAAFRQAELDLLDDLSGQNEVVISTGGGTLTRPETLAVAKETGTLIYLFAPVEVLYERVIFSYKERPMLNVPNSETVFQERFLQRETFYRQADFVIETHQKTTAQVVEAIQAKLLTFPE